MTEFGNPLKPVPTSRQAPECESCRQMIERTGRNDIGATRQPAIGFLPVGYVNLERHVPVAAPVCRLCARGQVPEPLSGRMMEEWIAFEVTRE